MKVELGKQIPRSQQKHQENYADDRISMANQ